MRPDVSTRPQGAWVTETGGTHFRVWAPRRREVAVELEGDDGVRRLRALAPERDAGGREGAYFSAHFDDVRPGTLYRYCLDSSLLRPDPRTRFQPQGVHGPSQVISAHTYQWRDQHWRGLSRDQLIFYELHVGTFTEEGTFRAAIAQLDELVALGITAVELMPIVPSAGRWNWGYDGVDIFAVRETYGHPDDCKAFVDAAHARNLAVVLDVVYNHLGPEGNYLSDFGPYFSNKHHTPWGEAFNYDGPESRPVRDYVIENALMWLDEYHFDGLRIDAIQYMVDDSDLPIAHELGKAVRELETQRDRRLLLIGETNVFERDYLLPLDEGGAGFDAIWCDDFLHSLGMLLTGEKRTPRTFLGAADVAAVLEQGALYQGPHPGGRIRTDPQERLDLSRLVWSIQNHDFIGNHPLGHRLTMQTSPAAHRAAAALMLLSPAIPLLFMGEEFATSAPFHFFTDFGDAHLREAVVSGRRAEYPQELWEQSISPFSEDAFVRSRRGLHASGDAGMVRWYHDLIECRRRWQADGLLRSEQMQVICSIDRHVYALQYTKDALATFLIVRLAPQGTASDVLEVPLDGQILLNSEWTTYGGTQDPSGPTKSPALLSLPMAIAGQGRLLLDFPARPGPATDQL